MASNDRNRPDGENLTEDVQVSSERFSGYVPRLLELVNDLVLSVSPADRKILYLNKSAETIYGRPLRELVENKQLWFEAILEEDREELAIKLDSIDENRRFEQDFRIVHPDGSRRFLEGSFRSISDDSGEQVAIGCIAKDITNRIKAEVELEESKAIYHSLVESLPINVFRKDREGRLVFVNNKTCETFGESRDQLIGKCDHDLFEKELADKYQNDDRWVLQTGLPFHDIEQHPQDDHKFIYVEILKAPVTSSSGRRIGIQGMFWDVTDRKNAEIALENARDIAEAASQAKSDFLANVSHEIRTPLNAVIGMTDILLSSSKNKTQSEYLHMIQDSGQSLLTLINDILDFSKIESGTLTLNTEWFDLRERLGDTLRTLAHRAHSKNVELICNLDPGIPVLLLGDSQRLRQIVVNLVGNSIKFTERGEISVDVELIKIADETARLKLQIHDTGIGIPEDKLADIFEEFVQVDTSSTRKFGGTGLGLSIASRLVSLMGGQLQVSSVMGKGSQFFFELSCRVGANPKLPFASEELSEVAILVMAANPLVRESIETILKSWRMKSICVSSVEQAIKLITGMAFANQPIQIVLAESHRNDVAMEEPCDCGLLVSQLDGLRDISIPPVIEIAKAYSHDNEQPTSPLISSRILQPLKHSELLAAITDSLQLESAPLSAEQQSTLPSGAGPYNILLAEDNPVNQKLVVGILKKLGHNLTVVDDGKKAVEAVSNEQFDLVLMDVQMPEMDGLEATRQIRSMELSNQSKVPVLAMTAHAMVSDRQKCLESGMDDYLSKPFKANDLIEKINLLIANRSGETGQSSQNGENVRTMIDWNRAFETVGGDRQLLREIIDVFLNERDKMIAELVAAIDKSNSDDILRAARSLKGALIHLGAVIVAKTAENIEKDPAADPIQNTENCRKLQNQLNQLTVELERFKNSH